MEIRWIQILAVFVFAGCSVVEASELYTLCGAELVDAIEFVCGDFNFRMLTSQSNSRRFRNGIVEECCVVGCSLQWLEQMCAMPSQKRNVKSKREAVPVPSPLTTEVPQKKVIVKYSKYDVWQQKAIQRMPRDIPAILRTWTFRKPAKIKAQ